MNTDKEVTRVSGSGLPLRGNDIDTDQITPARFLKVVTFEGLEQYVFYDQRYDDEGEPVEHPFNREEYQEASIMVVNRNFGCGSSREHAPQALVRWGIDAFIGESFAEIFAGNCLALGVPTVTAPGEAITDLQDWVEAHPGEEMEMNLEEERVSYGDSTMDVAIEPARKKALTTGAWDTASIMRENLDEVRNVMDSLPYIQNN